MESKSLVCKHGVQVRILSLQTWGPSDSLKCYLCTETSPCDSDTVLDCGSKEVMEVLGPSKSCWTKYDANGNLIFASCSREDLNTCRDVLDTNLQPLGKECFCQTSLCNGNSLRCYHCWDEGGVGIPCDAQMEVDCLYGNCMEEYDADGKSRHTQRYTACTAYKQ
ncbi:unnamed protein product, partial [Cyprideis torosa]